MSAIRSETGVPHMQSYKEFVEHALTMAMFFYLYSLIFTILANSGYMIEYKQETNDTEDTQPNHAGRIPFPILIF